VARRPRRQPSWAGSSPTFVGIPARFVGRILGPWRTTTGGGDVADTMTATAGPRWQRIALVAVGVYGAMLAFVTPAGTGAIVPSAMLLALAGTFALSAPGNRPYKLVVLIGLAVLLLLAILSIGWD
jgi:hypothetical protein